MKIAILHYSAPPIVGGVESVLAHHARLLTKAGHQVTIIAGRGSAFDERIPVLIYPHLDSRDPEVMEVKTLLDRGLTPPSFEILNNQIQEEIAPELRNFDVLIVHNVVSLNKNLPLAAALHDLYLNPGFPRLILWHHDLAWTTPRYRPELHDGYPWDLLRTHWEGVSHVVVSEIRRLELADLLGIREESIRVIPNGVDHQSFYKLEPETVQLVDRLDLLSADPLFLLPVRLTPRKNIEFAINIIAELRKEYPRARLLVTGPEGPHNPANAAYKQSLLQLKAELGLQSVVHFLAEETNEFLPDAVIADFYRLADALIFPSREEGFGIPLIEAGFSSIPVFCANIPVLIELGGRDVSAFGLDDSPADVAKLISTRLKNEVTFRWARRAKHGYAWDAIYRTFIEPLIQEVTP